MPNLVGIGLSQVPTNSMLGGLAYQDPEHASIKNLDLKNLSQINSEIADTASAIFVYDTRKDSDGGAWRKRTQNTSWYNETLGTLRRGTRREFPAVAVIVAENDVLTIYDGDDPDLPMWMKWTTINGQQRMLRGDASRALAAKNGIIAITNASTYGGLVKIYFVSDTARSYRAIGSSNNSEGYWRGPGIASRDDYSSNNYSNSSGGNVLPALVSENTKDVAMTVLPNAPIDDATGLPVPTIAVATAGGVSVIEDNGSVYDLNVANRPYSSVDFTSDNLIFAVENPGGVTYDLLRYFAVPSADITSSPSYGPNSTPALFPSNTKGNFFSNHAYGSPIGLTIIDHADGTSPSTNGMVAYVTKDYNTGYMHGDIKGAFLSDTTVESLTANTNLASNVLNGGTNRLTSHTYDSGDTAWQMVDNASSANGYVSLDLRGLTIGQSYVVSMTWDNNATLDSGYEHRIAHLNGLAGENATNFTHWNKTNGSSETLTGSFVAQSVDDETLVVYANAITLNISNFNIRAVDDEDRSVNNNGLAVYGTVTKSAIATGSDLVAYSNFSTSNHLRQPPNSDMNIGTGDAYEMIWYKTTVTSGTMMLMSYEGGANGTSDYGKPFNIRFHNGNVHGWASHNNFTTYDDVVHPVNTADGFWHCAAWVKRGQVFEFYVDGEFVGSDTGAVGSNALSDANTELVIGARKRGKNPGDSEEPFTNGSLALARIGKTAPTAEQIKKMYEDEKHLFQENAKCTLHGSSDAVTALAYDDTTNLLHAGTSSGRSEFQGLRRINNTTTAVTTAISASNGLVAEQ